MDKFFSVSLEFNNFVIKDIIERSIEEDRKGYVCIVDANVLVNAQNNKNYCDILNNAIVNSCDGSSIAMLTSLVYKKKMRAWNGPDIFSYYIEQKYSQLLLGSNDETLDQIKDKLRENGCDNNHISVMTLPFMSVEDFDYDKISQDINYINPDIIWVSLGAPKQEIFMSKLQPYLTKGIMFGIGAAFNFYTGKIALPNVRIGPLKFIWISRIISEPRKQIKRIIPYLMLMPKLYLEERKKRLSNKIDI